MRPSEQRLHGAREEVLSFPEADDERALVPRRDDLAGLLRADGRDGERPFEPPEHPRQRFPQALSGLDPPGDEVGHHLGVRLGAEDDAPALELLFELREVLDDAVVHDGDGPISAELWMGVLLGRSPVGRPTGVPHPGLYRRKSPLRAATAWARFSSRPTSLICSMWLSR